MAGQCGVNEVVQRLHGLAVDEQWAGGLHALFGAGGAGQRGGGQVGIVARFAGILAGVFQGRACLQALDLGNHACVQHFLRGRVVLFDALQRCFAQHGCAVGQLGAKVTLYQ